MTVNEIECAYKCHHVSYARGYVSRKIDGIVKPYAGKFGTGYVIHRPAWTSTRYHMVEYYVDKR